MRKLLDINRMAELGWTSKLSLEDGINKTVQTKFGENI
jgi:nucleoside-diphosphate-sugar epimerase